MVIRRLLTSNESGNVISHGIGVALALTALIVLILKIETNHLLSYTLYAGTLIVLYLSSTLYHAITHPATKHIFRKADHIAIFLLIAGTYTPFCMEAVKGLLGWVILTVIWTLAVAGIIFKTFFTGRFEIISIALYLLMGWTAIVVIKPLYDALPGNSFIYLIAGGIMYSTGVLFYLNKQLRYHHSIWHIFVLGGSIFHFFSIINIRVPGH